MKNLRFLTAFWMLVALGCKVMCADEVHKFDVEVVRVEKGRLTYHLNGEAFAYDIITVKITSSGRFHDLKLPIAVPQKGTLLYERLIKADPARSEMWRLLVGDREICIAVGNNDLLEFLEARKDESRLLPSLDVLQISVVDRGHRPD